MTPRREALAQMPPEVDSNKEVLRGAKEIMAELNISRMTLKRWRDKGLPVWQSQTGSIVGFRDEVRTWAVSRVTT